MFRKAQPRAASRPRTEPSRKRGRPTSRAGRSIAPTVVPRTEVPASFHVVESSILPPPPRRTADGGSTIVTRDGDSVRWNTTSFPSARPGGRQEVAQLNAMLRSMLDKVEAPAPQHPETQEPLHYVRESLRVAEEEELVYSLCLSELVRQASVLSANGALGRPCLAVTKDSEWQCCTTSREPSCPV